MFQFFIKKIEKLKVYMFHYFRLIEWFLYITTRREYCVTKPWWTPTRSHPASKGRPKCPLKEPLRPHATPLTRCRPILGQTARTRSASGRTGDAAASPHRAPRRGGAPSSRLRFPTTPHPTPASRGSSRGW
jgi:hypothetical protein